MVYIKEKHKLATHQNISQNKCLNTCGKISYENGSCYLQRDSKMVFQTDCSPIKIVRNCVQTVLDEEFGYNS